MIDRHFASWLKAKARVLYLPIALGWEESAYAKAEAWIRSVFEPLGIAGMIMWTNLSSHRPEELGDFDGMYIGGGNTFRLLFELRRTGFGTAMLAFAEGGRPIYGGSAGAAVLGRDITTVSHIDSNSVGLTDTRGLSLVGECYVWVHYQDSHRMLVEQYLKSRGGRCLVLTERSAAAIDGKRMSSVGFDPAYLVDERNWERLPEA
jgi:dipeptidase E